MRFQRSSSSYFATSSAAQDLPKDEKSPRVMNDDKMKNPPGRDAGSDESEIRGRNELADGRDEPVYSRPTFPSGTSNLNSSHQNGASSSSGRRWVLRRWDTAPPVRAPSSTYTVYTVVHTGLDGGGIIVHLRPLRLCPCPRSTDSSSFRKLLFFVPAIRSLIAQSAVSHSEGGKKSR